MKTFFTSASLQIGLVSSLVQSILAILTSFLTEYWVAKRSHLGANFWQCPHHGAKNLTKVYPGCLISFSNSSFVARILDSDGSGLSLLSLTNCWSSCNVLKKNRENLISRIFFHFYVKNTWNLGKQPLFLRHGNIAK